MPSLIGELTVGLGAPVTERLPLFSLACDAVLFKVKSEPSPFLAACLKRKKMLGRHRQRMESGISAPCQ